MFKNRSFRRVKELSKSNRTWNRVFPVYLESKTKTIFGIACLGKKLALFTEICDYFQFLIFKYSVFHRVKELLKSNQTGHGVYHGYLDCKTRIMITIACLGKKLAFHTEICD